ncbi:MAG: hypothetical protein KA375_16955 [Vitreoscilla sp.]|jgi:hypothetical protein|nr:hypothetical protein [Burkholderiales bacterium]MBP6339293.1 hypothetical protein [Vitreoscilla sp.]
MRLPRRPLRWLASLLMGSLLFMQLATAAYVCPMEGRGDTAGATAMAEMEGCDGQMAGMPSDAPMDSGQAPLCKAHCEEGSQTPSASPNLNAGTTPVLFTVLDWAPANLLPGQPAPSAPAAQPGAPPPGFPPLYIALQVLRH